eukprot:scaffold4473_cov105-Pinguiococcus_pyrenoidosus.AAC.1
MWNFSPDKVRVLASTSRADAEAESRKDDFVSVVQGRIQLHLQRHRACQPRQRAAGSGSADGRREAS